MTINHGPCQGGPYDGKLIAHPTATFRVAIDETAKIHYRPISNAVPGVVAAVEPSIKFGTYHFSSGTWTWNESAQSAGQNPVDNENG